MSETPFIRASGFEETRRDRALKENLLEAIPDPIFLLNSDGSIDQANPAAITLFGLDPRGYIGRDFCSKILAPICQDSFRLSFNRMVRGENETLTERRIEISALRSDRSNLMIELWIRPLALEGQTKYLAFARDISEARKTESLLRESESRFRHIFDSNVIPVLFWDFQGNIRDANDAFLKLTGYSRLEMLEKGLKWADLITSTSDQTVKTIREKLERTGVSSGYELTLVLRGGSKIPVLVWSAVFENARNNGVTLIHDMTHFRRTMQNLENANSAMKTALDHIPLGVYVKDTDQRFRLINATAAKGFARAADEIIGKTASELNLRNAEINNVIDRKILLTGESTSVDLITGYSGKDIHIRVHKMPYRDAEGRIIGILGVGEDRTLWKDLEARVTSAEEKQHLVAESTIELVMIHDVHGHTIFSNRAARLHFGPTDWSSIRLNHVFFTPEGASLSEENRPEKAILTGASTHEAVIRIRPKFTSLDESTDRWFVQKSSALKDSNGTLTGVVSTFRDVTEIRRLEESNRQHAAAVKASIDGIAIHDENGVFLHVNEAYASIFGFEPREMIGKSWGAIWPELNDSLDSETLSRLQQSGTYRSQWVLQKKNGSLVEVEGSMSVAGAHGYVCVIRDVTEERRALAIQGLLVKTSELMLSHKEPPEFCQELSAILCKGFCERCTVRLKDDSDTWRLELSQFLESGNSLFNQNSIKLPIPGRDGPIGMLSLERKKRSFQLPDLSLAEDIARRTGLWLENSALHKRHDAMSEAHDELLGLVAHNLKNPLSAILLGTGFLSRELERAGDLTAREQQVLEQMRTLEQSASRMNQQVSDLIDLGKLESGRLNLDRREYRIPNLISQAVADKSRLAEQRGQEIRSSVRIHRETGYFDRERLAQVVSAILENGLYVSPRGSTIEIEVEQTNHEFVFVIRDQGATGVQQTLWLPLCKGLIEAHGGSFTVENENGQGFAYRFTLPVGLSQ